MLIGFSFFMIIRKSTRCITAIKELDFGLIVQVAYIKIISNELKDLSNKQDKTTEENARFEELNNKANSEYQEYLIQKGLEEIKDLAEKRGIECYPKRPKNL